MDQGEASGAKSSLNFSYALGTNSPSSAMTVVENRLFDKELGVGGFAPSGGPCIPKIKGCLK